MNVLTEVASYQTKNKQSFIPAEILARHANTLLPWILPLSLIVLWQVSANYGWISAQVLPSPLDVLTTLSEITLNGDLWTNFEASIQRVMFGFLFGSIIGLILGTAMGLSKTIADYLLPSFNAIVQIPVLAWLPFILLLVGIGEALKYILIAKAAMVPVTLNTLQAFRQTSTRYREVGKVYGYTKTQEIIEIIFPASVPTLFTGFRLGFTKAWLSLVVVELVASSEGLGYLIVYGRQLFQLDLVMATVVVVGCLGFFIDRGFSYVEKKISKYYGYEML
jgi:sulfonate transport system permease protein